MRRHLQLAVVERRRARRAVQSKEHDLVEHRGRLAERLAGPRAGARAAPSLMPLLYVCERKTFNGTSYERTKTRYKRARLCCATESLEYMKRNLRGEGCGVSD